MWVQSGERAHIARITGKLPDRGKWTNFGRWAADISTTMGILLNLILMANLETSHALTATECFAAMQTFDKNSKTIALKVSAGDDQIGLLLIYERNGSPNLQDKSASIQLLRICSLAGVRKAFRSYKDSVDSPFAKCDVNGCRSTKEQLKKVIPVSEFIKISGNK